MISSSAPGKLVVFGEHAVVFGYPCIVMAIDKKISISIEKSEADRDEIVLPENIDNYLIKKTLEIFRNKFRTNKFLRIISKSEFSEKLGLGSSSASVVAMIRALSKFYNLHLSSSDIFELSHRAVLSVQPDNSGTDIAAAVYGGILYYQKPGQIKIISHGRLPLIVAYSGQKAKSADMIKQVKSLFKRRRKTLLQLFIKMENIVNEATDAIEKNNFIKLGELMNINHQLLKDLNVSTTKLDKMVEAAISSGAWGAKLSGAGGGDCIIVLVSDSKKDDVCKSIKKVGGKIIKF
ncbi:mevalonate kinase [Candidatus Roizmanbacteria bacterium RIFCSPHIGHO2_02_FULL_37_13b]|uniref:Mevalonate kinase n=1 Tax=Candidatus Roizmanbacteria bacterium RIFCSPLOWO2_02_FULL_36_11 TaxID=1802071 RepID=A0A1F7JC71_9BACT|nr:MAG: mevalonate kinase [Candidatus Roizmanbacteria bacterium RIFCSPHIGHO2_02_FULL_37_13b]OGK53202.1 MAG: mevalonate kinase [Candidatus Roizmanbacteria bacterium RIFCSPLOWO2_02_FULL_36_11]